VKRIYVGNLNPAATAGLLETLFADFGRVTKAGIITDPVSGRSKGFGFVLMENDVEGDDAINQLNQKSVHGSILDVKEAVPAGEERNWTKKAARGRP
jgi:RNA recognition motif-containing protein